MKPGNKWRTMLDPRDPDYLDGECDQECCDEESENDYLTDDELDQAASDAEGK
ncbi:hypothetical protein D3C80_1707380 [compost metagenome]